MANQKGGLPFTISDWFRPQYEPNVCLLLNHKETFQSRRDFFFFSQKAGLCDLRFFFLSHHWEIRSHSRALLKQNMDSLSFLIEKHNNNKTVGCNDKLSYIMFINKKE